MAAKLGDCRKLAFVRVQVEKAQLLAGPPQEPAFHEEEEDVPVEAEELV